MITINDLHKFSHRLTILYVEDNTALREETAKLFEPLFARVDLAANGKEGLEKYNHSLYDIVITDINMPVMNGVDMIARIREINPEQKVIAISAHDETEILISIIRNGISSFILKPINLQELMTTLYPVCRDADTQKVNVELFEELQEERKKLKRMVGILTSHLRTLEIKNEQIGDFCAQNEPEDRSQLLQEYFAKDEDEGDEKVLFIWDDCEEMTDILGAIPDQLSRYIVDRDIEHIRRIRDDIGKISNILFRYTPFMDPLAENLEALKRLVAEEKDIIAMLESKPDHILNLFDAICIDLSMYVKRFSQESMAMKNIHHIHQPTSLSIQQIISLISPQESNGDDGDIEFF
ncbi:response regulator [Sulfuricurvum sp.]|uniref:response regulator n=1 Tax=Sulfuricurvum sp. TaxID=2025608 RepID=UPI0026230FD2|nr:response regulator [Sulfuricurvum sp.]MDD3597583.1 response regulator [Sulfuricurvum sp.]